MGKVKTGERAKVSHGGGVVELRQSYFIERPAQPDIAAVNSYLGFPPTVSRAPENSFIPRRIGTGFFTIARVLFASAGAKVLSSVVKSVAILVICLTPFPPANNQVHKYVIVSSVETLGVVVEGGSPVPLHEPLVVSSVHDSVMALRKGNETNRLILRLDNSVSFHVELHDLSSKEIVRRSAAFLL